MSQFLSSLPIWLSLLVVVVVPTAAATCGPILIRRRIKLEHLAANNEVAGFKFAVIGVVYAVLLGFAVIVVWEKFRDAQSAVVQEASGVIALSRLSDGLEKNVAADVHQHLARYVEAAIAADWPAMAQGASSPEVGQLLSELYRSVLAVMPNNAREAAIMAAMLNELDVITDGRRARLELAAGIVPGVLWAVLVAGAVITLTFTFFFGARSVGAQAMMSGMLAAITFMALYVVVEVEHPFTGPVSVDAQPLQTALASFLAPR